MDAQAFAPAGPNAGQGVAVTAGSTLLMTINPGAHGGIRLVNSGPNLIFLEILPAAASAPTASITTSMAMLPNTVEVFCTPYEVKIYGIAPATGNTLYATPGTGS